jgi:hypothetical protein
VTQDNLTYAVHGSRPNDPRSAWQQRVVEISQRLLSELTPELQDELVRPLARELGDQLRDLYRAGDYQRGDFEIDKFELGLRLVLEQLQRSE